MGEHRKSPATMTTMSSATSKVFGNKLRATAPSSSFRARGVRAVTMAKVKNEAPVSEREFRQNLGYTEKDSAGQANIFAVEPQVYLQGEENTALVLGVTIVGLAAAFGLGYTLVNQACRGRRRPRLLVRERTDPVLLPAEVRPSSATTSAGVPGRRGASRPSARHGGRRRGCRRASCHVSKQQLGLF